MKPQSLGRLTLEGGPGVESFLADLVERARAAILKHVSARHLEALVLGGGYGRGEGGVRRDPEGGERPANNLDLILFTRRLDAEGRARLTATLEPLLARLRRESGIGLDFSAVDARWMAHDRVRVLWYDVRHGHRLLAGNPDFLPGLKRFTAGNIDPREMADLVVNRGALLVLNELIRGRGDQTSEVREAMLTHAAKAVIGFGDALLFFSGRYHWSYVQKRRRMRKDPHVSAEFRALYDQAMAYRFTGDETAAAGLVRCVENGELRKTLSVIFLDIERGRLAAPDLSWAGQVRRSLRWELKDAASSLRNLARGALTLVRGHSRRATAAPYDARIALRAGGERAAVRALFPLAAFGRIDRAEEAMARQILGVSDLKSAPARLAWLQMWGRAFDRNFASTQRRFGLTRRMAA